ncbi:MAG: hypothetical protein ACYTGG_13470, partial [Planctomycetota bacterium]
MTGMRRRFTSCVGIVAAAIAVAPALAQTTRPAQSSPPSKTPAGLLAGPAVEPDAMGPAPGGFGGSERRNRAIVVPARRWIEVLDQLDLTADQKRDARTIRRQLRHASQAFQKKHGTEMKQLVEIVQAARQGGTQPDDATRARFETLQ